MRVDDTRSRAQKLQRHLAVFDTLAVQLDELAQAVTQVARRAPASGCETLRRQQRVAHIARARLGERDVDRRLRDLSQKADELQDGSRNAAGDVHRYVVRHRECGLDRAHHVGDVYEIAALLPVAMHRQAVAGERALRKHGDDAAFEV